MSKGSDDTQQTTQATSTSYPQWQQSALQGINQAGLALAQNSVKPSAYQTAGMNADQLKAFDLARQTAQNAYQGGATGISGPTSMQAAQVGAPTMAGSAQVGAPTMATAAQVNPNAIAGGMNPYLAAVLAPAMKQAERSRDSNMADIGAKAAAAGAFGGSREALQRGQADRAFQESTQTMVANLMSQGWDQASALAQANASMQQQTALTNAGAANTAALQQAGYDQQTGLTNAAAANANQQLNAGYQQAANQTNLNYGLSRAQMEDALKSNDLSRQQSAMQQMLGIGNQQQLFGQTVLDQPWTALSRYASLVPQNLNASGTGTTTSPDNSASPFQQLLGAGTAVLGMGTGGGGTIAGGIANSLFK